MRATWSTKRDLISVTPPGANPFVLRRWTVDAWVDLSNGVRQKIVITIKSTVSIRDLVPFVVSEAQRTADDLGLDVTDCGFTAMAR